MEESNSQVLMQVNPEFSENWMVRLKYVFIQSLPFSFAVLVAFPTSEEYYLY